MAKRTTAARGRCTENTAAGKRCSRLARPGEKTCAQHAEGGSRRGGRPTLLGRIMRETPSGAPITNVDLIEQAIRAGAPFKDAAEAAGVSERAFHDWQDRGKRWINDEGEIDPDTPDVDLPFAQFAQRVKRADAEAIVSAVATVRQAAQGRSAVFLTDDKGQVVLDGKGKPIVLQAGAAADWYAAAWLAERRRPNEFARPKRVEHSGAIDVGGERQVEDLRKLPVAERQQILKLREEEERLLAQARQKEA